MMINNYGKFINLLLIITIFGCGKTSDENFIDYKLLLNKSNDLIYHDPLLSVSLSDSIIQLATVEQNQEFIAKGMVQKAKGLFFLQEYQESLRILDTIDFVVNLNEYSDINYHLYNTYGLIYQDLGQMDSSIIYYQKSIGVLNEVTDSIKLASVYSNMGGVFFTNGYHEIGIDHLLKALNYLESSNNPNYLALVLANLSGAFLSMKDYETSLKYADQTIQKLNNQVTHSVIVALNNKAEALFNLNQYSEAIKIAKLSMDFCFQNQDSLSLTYARNILAKSLSKKGNDKEAENIHRRNLNYELRKNLIIEASSTYCELGNIKRKLNKNLEAKSLYENALKLSKQSGSLDDQFEVSLASLRNELQLRKLSHFEKSLNNILAINDSLYSDRIVRAVKNAEIKYQTEKKEQEILILNQCCPK